MTTKPVLSVALPRWFFMVTLVWLRSSLLRLGSACQQRPTEVKEKADTADGWLRRNSPNDHLKVRSRVGRSCFRILSLTMVAASSGQNMYGADGATLVSQTVPDNTVLNPGQTFTKSWTLRNTGTTSWTPRSTGYTLNFLNGDRMGAASSLTLSSSVAVNGQATFSVELTAPTTPGNYTGNWRMNSEVGIDFGPTVTVKIVVSPGKPNLTPFKPDGWSDKIVVTRRTGSTTDDTDLAPSDTLYVNWAVLNNGAGATSARFYTELYVDGTLKTGWWSSPPLAADWYSHIDDYSIGSLRARQEITFTTDDIIEDGSYSSILREIAKA